MKSSQLAWIMFALGVAGAALLAGTLYLWVNLDFGLSTDRQGLVGFLSLLFVGAFLAALWQAWFGIFSGWTGRVLGAGHAGGSTLGVVLGTVGFFSVVAMVIVIVGVGADGSERSATVGMSIALAVQTMLLVLESRWISGFSRRCASADQSVPTA